MGHSKQIRILLLNEMEKLEKTLFRLEQETGSHYVAQVDIELLDSSNPPSLASESTGITSISHRAWPQF
ncbi:AGL isoform 5 [Pan troglodytes]|uniref:Amylo-alpha-1, 6-glucosidase, 4-alpha-glucanotransferase n=2 Tax=Homininae TaxID=207598 RepID=A0A1C7CYW1_HUMAN|nr:amylo-alpha-1, 6-glucosidase, 4-alpha-glucanotransferase [Homo sapiens]KAI4081568.1 amylo-alpha-1, 6-glucosidase, 4-alpha-glucanotransferase [Homo sapiens]PNI59008.1 AGL isoform 5 [Pan troglodytes]